MSDVIDLNDQFYIHARSPLIDIQTRVLMRGDLVGVFDRCGDMRPLGFGGHGLFFNESRHLSRSVLRLASEPLLLLSSTVTRDNARLCVDLTNPVLNFPDGRNLLHRSLHFQRTKSLQDNHCQEEIRVLNYSLQPVSLDLMFELEADFTDIFEVRGYTRKTPGQMLIPEVNNASLVLSYRGVDQVTRKTAIRSSLQPTAIGPSEMRFRVELEPQQEKAFTITIACSAVGERSFPGNRSTAHTLTNQTRVNAVSKIGTSNAHFNDWINRSRADLEMMITPVAEGLYPYAGVPWFSTIFGRDGIITALEYLWVDPDVAKGV
ncbi:MAG TPA: glycogen debranching N-terminal domain-containing protein, partial [Chthoniobacterales bacterium]|nr:glycogen debranching N-terminal domain-containing protein [Chthoniobacterales bacterium]